MIMAQLTFRKNLICYRLQPLSVLTLFDVNPKYALPQTRGTWPTPILLLTREILQNYGLAKR
jgi:hypothetical protein